MRDMQLPYFVVIGAMKSGTSSLHYYLDKHPEISMPYARKELDFFNNNQNWLKGLEWYKENFRKNNLKKGEVSPNYTMSPEPGSDIVPKRMCSILPDAYLIYILRDPIERMLSQVHHLWVDGRETRGIDKIIDDNLDSRKYRRYSMYNSQLEEFLRYYKREKILIITLERLSASPEVVMSKVFDFLQVNPAFYHESFVEVKHASSEKRVPGKIQQLFDNTVESFSNNTFFRKLLSLVPRRISNRLDKFLGKSIPKPRISPAQEAKLINFFKEDVAKLREYTGREFSEWKYEY